MIGQLVTAAGFALLLHTTFAVSKYRDALKVTQRAYDGVPPALQLELLLGALLALAGGCALAGRLKPIVSDKGAPSLDQGSYRPDCVFFGHRSRALPRIDIPSVY